MSIWISGNEEALFEQAAAYITATAYRAVAQHGRFTLVLAGGSTPKQLYEKLALGVNENLFEKFGLTLPKHVKRSAQDHEAITLPWAETYFFQGDERYVPKSHPDSNYGMVSETLMHHGCIPRENMFGMPVESGDPEADALRYEVLLRAFFRKGTAGKISRLPSFDLVLLGLGSDGHTASLFPEDAKALDERDRWVIAVNAPWGNPPGTRLTLTLPVINNADSVIFLVPSTRYGLALSIHEGMRPDLPAGMVSPYHGQATWFVAEPEQENTHP